MSGGTFITIAALFAAMLVSAPVQAAKYCGKFIGTVTPSLVVTGQTFNVDVTVRNCGTFTWSTQDPNRVYLVQHWYKGGKLTQWNAARTLVPKQGKPKAALTILAKVKAPPSGGNFMLKWDLVHVDATNVEHWFSKAGTKMATDNFTVLAPIIAKVLEPTNPKIKSAYYHDVKPGQQGLIFGNWFTNAVGKLHLTLPSGKSVPLSVIKWTPLVIHFKTPPVTGEKDGFSTIKVQTAYGLVSDGYQLPFKATREIREVGDALEVANCHDALLASDKCIVDTFISIFGSHKTQCCINGDNGTDKYRFKLPLQNGWLFEKNSFDWWAKFGTKHMYKSSNCLGNCPDASLSVKGSKGSKQTEFVVDWDTGMAPNGVYYYINVYARGPKGIPYK